MPRLPMMPAFKKRRSIASPFNACEMRFAAGKSVTSSSSTLAPVASSSGALPRAVPTTRQPSLGVLARELQSQAPAGAGDEDRGHQPWISTGVYGATRSKSSTMSRLRMRMQPIEPGLPISALSGVPWI